MRPDQDMLTRSEILIHIFNIQKDRFTIEAFATSSFFQKTPELKISEWDNLNPDRLINLEINNKRITSIICSELKTLELDTLNPDHLIRISIVETYDFLNPLFWYTLIGRIVGTLVDKDYNNLKINKKRRSSINLDIHNSKVFSSGD